MASIFFSPLTRAQSPEAAPVFQITSEESSIKFDVEASVAITGKFEKWDATLKFSSTDLATGVLDIKIEAATVNTGSGIKDGKLKGKDFFDVKANPYITVKSDKIVQTGPMTFDAPGTFTIRGVGKPETLKLDLSRDRATGAGEIKGNGMNSGIPFIKIADRVKVNVALKIKRVSGTPVNLKQ